MTGTPAAALKCLENAENSRPKGREFSAFFKFVRAERGGRSGASAALACDRSRTQHSVYHQAGVVVFMLQVERRRTRSSAPGLTPVSITEFAATESSRRKNPHRPQNPAARRRPRRARHRPKTLSLHSCPPASGATATGVPRKTPVPYSRPVRRTYCRLSCGVRRRQSAATSLPPRLCLASVVKSAPLSWFVHKLTGKCDGPVTFCVRGCDMV